MKGLVRVVCLLAGALLAGGLQVADAKKGPEKEPKTESHKKESKKEPKEEGSTDLGLKTWLKSDFLFVESPELLGYLNSIAAKLLKAGGENAPAPHILIRSLDEYNAFSDSAGDLIVNSALLRQVQSEDELAAVLGHELGHLLLGHTKSRAARARLPEGIESTGILVAAAKQLNARNDARNAKSKASFAQRSLYGSQGVSLILGDLLSPAWNRKQEQLADRKGLDLMRAAGYDPAAFDAFFSKLSAAQARRSHRLDLLKQVAGEELKKKLKTKNSAKPAANDSFTTQVKTKTHEMSVATQEMIGDKFIDAVVDRLAKLNEDYDPPEVRTQVLKAYIAEKYPKPRDKTPRSMAYKEVLRQGRGGAVLSADSSALDALAGLATQNLNGAQQHAGRIAIAANGRPLSPHLNFALSEVYESQRKIDFAEVRVATWLQSSYAPETAYLKRAQHQANRRDYTAAIKTLERGAKTLDNWRAFLPPLVTAARMSQQKKLAADYTKRCAEEDRKAFSLDVLAALSKNNQGKPTGLYGECVQRLGYDPAVHEQQEAQRKAAADGASTTEKMKEGASKAGKAVADTTKTVAGKIKGVFSRDKDKKSP